MSLLLLLALLFTNQDGALLTWSDPGWGVTCPMPHHLYLYEAYIDQCTGYCGYPGDPCDYTCGYVDGVQILPPSQTSLLLAPGKPNVQCAIMWDLKAQDANYVPLSPECQPADFRADGLTWEGI
jgi:hypothetical protein